MCVPIFILLSFKIYKTFELRQIIYIQKYIYTEIYIYMYIHRKMPVLTDINAYTLDHSLPYFYLSELFN